MTAFSTFNSSALWEAVARGDANKLILGQATATLPSGTFEEFASDISAKIERSANRAARRARQAADVLKEVGVYEHLNDARHRHAAEVAELFRDGKVAGNAGHIDARVLQRRIARAIHEGEPLVYELGWGQAKRSVGGLKTQEASADLAEMIAIARLATVTRATQLLLDQSATLRILSGGQRFYEALFTRPRVDDAYNDQRAAIAARLGQADIISIRRGEFGAADDLRAQLAASSDRLRKVPSPLELRFMQLSIDWEHVFELAEKRPHGLQPPSGFSSTWANLCQAGRSLLLRNLFIMLVRPSMMASEQWSHLIDAQTFAQTVNWMAEISKESAIKYALLGEITRRDSETRVDDPRICRLTVIEKNNQPEVPVLTLLGSRHGNFLPQHVVPVIHEGSGQMRFAPRMSVPTSYTLVQTCILGKQPQALFFTGLPWEVAMKALQKTDLVNLVR